MIVPRPSRFDALVLACALAAIALGIGFRIADLGAPLFWQDESYTALRVTGHLEDAYLKIFDGRIHPVRDVLAFVSLDRTRGADAVVRAIAAEDPHHSPLFYALDRIWIGAFGTAPAGFRGLSVALGVLGIGLVFALATALQRSRIGGAVTAALFALAPIFVLYARQAREYAFFADGVVLATLALVSAVRASSPGRWLAYAATVALGSYIDPIFVLVAIAHGISVLWIAPARVRTFGAWLAASALGGLAFAPWALNAYRSSENIAGQMDWGRTAYPLQYLAMKWAFNIGALAFDGEFRSLALAPLALAVVVAVGVGVWLFFARGEREIVAYVVPLAATTLVVFVVRDALFNSHFSTIVRYLTPLWLGLVIMGGAVVARGLRARRSRAFAFGVWVALLGLGVSAATLRGGAENWWDNNDQIAFQAVAREIDRAPRPLVISESHPHVPLLIARYLRPDAQFLMFARELPPIPSGRNVFVIAPSLATRTAIVARTRGRYRLENVSPDATTIIGSFHTKLDRAKPELLRGDTLIFYPENALWALVPVRASRTSS